MTGSRATTPPRSWAIEPVWSETGAPADGPADRRGGSLPDGLRQQHPGPLEIALRPDRPVVAVNFVSTLDGVVALDRDGATGGREISGAFEPDRFMMGLLRTMADAVLVGAGTVRASRVPGWTPAIVHPASRAAYGAWRTSLGLGAAPPTTVIVTGSGDVPPAILQGGSERAHVVVLTTETGWRRLREAAREGSGEIVAVSSGDRVPVEAVLDELRDRGFRLVLSEGGPGLFGELLAAGAVDELFLTVAPQLVGRSADVTRRSLVEGVGFSPASAPWARLSSIERCENHLFLRYRTNQGDPQATGGAS